jgi:hypothetical protein
MPKCSVIGRALIAMAAVVLTAAPAWAAEDTTGKITIETNTVGVGLGVTWGNGVLEYRGQEYPFTVTGFSLGEVGAAKTVARGEVYNLQRPEDFAGVFMAASAGATVGGGAGAAAMKNQNSVDMVWTGTNQGLSFSLAQGGLNVKLTETAQQAARNQRQPSGEGQTSASPKGSL